MSVSTITSADSNTGTGDSDSDSDGVSDKDTILRTTNTQAYLFIGGEYVGPLGMIIVSKQIP